MKSTFILILLGILLMAIIAWYIIELGSTKKSNKTGKPDKRGFDDYEFRYKFIKKLIAQLPVNQMNYDYIDKFIKSLDRMDHKNTEKTEVLYNEFLIKYESL